MDSRRDNYLRGMGQEVVRYSNIEFLQNQDGAIEDIFERVKARAGGIADLL
jgi:very-short-patch-repair endonuclease